MSQSSRAHGGEGRGEEGESAFCVQLKFIIGFVLFCFVSGRLSRKRRAGEGGQSLGVYSPLPLFPFPIEEGMGQTLGWPWCPPSCKACTCQPHPGQETRLSVPQKCSSFPWDHYPTLNFVLALTVLELLKTCNIYFVCLCYIFCDSHLFMLSVVSICSFWLSVWIKDKLYPFPVEEHLSCFHFWH